MARTAEVLLEYQNYIETPPVAPKSLYGQACSNDETTIDSWRQTWIANVRANHKKFGSFKDRSVGKFYHLYKNKPCIVAGAGPSLKYNGHQLKDRGEIGLISCLHNFHFFEDNDVHVDFYVTLDAGEVTIEEVSEGGTKSEAEYWAATKKHKLLAYIGTSPRLLEKWQGEVYFFNCPVPDPEFTKVTEDLEKFHCYVSNGGNVLGACMYIAKGFMGANPIAFVGADFAFSYKNKFHAWDSKYDKKLGYVVKAIDVFGNKVLTWQSYANFKAWFDYVAINVPGFWVNCTEGGTFGAYPEGNIMAIRQMELENFLRMYQLSEELRDQAENPETAIKKILV